MVRSGVESKAGDVGNDSHSTTRNLRAIGWVFFVYPRRREVDLVNAVEGTEGGEERGEDS